MPWTHKERRLSQVCCLKHSFLSLSHFFFFFFASNPPSKCQKLSFYWWPLLALPVQTQTPSFSSPSAFVSAIWQWRWGKAYLWAILLEIYPAGHQGLCSTSHFSWQEHTAPGTWYTLHLHSLSWKLHTWGKCKQWVSWGIGICSKYLQRIQSLGLTKEELDWLWWVKREAEEKEKTQSVKKAFVEAQD